MTGRDHYGVHELRTAELDAIKRRLQANLIRLPPGCPETVPYWHISARSKPSRHAGLNQGCHDLPPCRILPCHGRIIAPGG